MMRPFRSVVLMIALGFLGAATPPQEPSQPDLTGVVTGEGFTRVKIALPDPQADTGASAAAREIIETLRDDLRFSGYFDVVDPVLYALLPAESREPVRHDDWLSIGADALVLTGVTAGEERVDVTLRLFDNQSRKLTWGYRYGGPASAIRRTAHQLADDLVRVFTGRTGIAATRIAYVARFGKTRELHVMDYDGRGVRRLTTTGAPNLSPAWSPDGERIALVSWRGGGPAIELLDAEGKARRLPTAGGDLNTSPEWSPDGRQIAYASSADGNPEIYVLDVASGRNRRLTRSAAIETAPSFSPNGREIAFTSDRSGTPQIYVMDVEGLNARRVTVDGHYADAAAWSPNGDRLAYAARIEGGFDIVVLDLETGTASRLTRGGGSNESPRWSPDGRHIVFASNRSGTWDLYSMAADGSGVRRLTRGADAATPDWSR